VLRLYRGLVKLSTPLGVMDGTLPRQRDFELRQFPPESASGQPGEGVGIPLAGNQRRQHPASAHAKEIGDDTGQLGLAAANACSATATPDTLSTEKTPCQYPGQNVCCSSIACVYKYWNISSYRKHKAGLIFALFLS
jgi:hypothetical protein